MAVGAAAVESSCGAAEEESDETWFCGTVGGVGLSACGGSGISSGGSGMVTFGMDGAGASDDCEVRWGRDTDELAGGAAVIADDRVLLSHGPTTKHPSMNIPATARI
jgi:hypothetical protein